MSNTSPKPPKIRCTEPGCEQQMGYSHSSTKYDIYRCGNRHIRKLPKNALKSAA